MATDPTSRTIKSFHAQQEMNMSDDFTSGLEVRNGLFGEERTKQAFANDDPEHQEFQTFITAYCFGSLWGKEGVVWRDRSLMTMAIVAAQHRFAEFETHLRLGIKNGCDKEVIFELIRHLTVYCGVPTGFEAFRTAQRVYQESAPKS
jgi:4-carboxymuconolactone decarboxylase